MYRERGRGREGEKETETETETETVKDDMKGMWGKGCEKFIEKGR